MRGMFTCGVTDVLMENGIRFDGLAGISAGAVFGCNVKSHQIGRAIRYNKKYGRDPRYVSFRSLIKTGDLYGVDFCYRIIPEELDPFDWDTFYADPMAFYVGATDVETGKIIFHKSTGNKEEDLIWMRASASMPFVSRVVEADGLRLLDGGIVCPIPYEYMEEMGYDRNIIVLTQPAGYLKEKQNFMGIMRVALRKYPKVADVMERRHEIYNTQTSAVAQREAEGKAFVIRPPEALGIKRTENDPSELERVYQVGRKAAEEAMPRLRRFLLSPV